MNGVGRTPRKFRKSHVSINRRYHSVDTEIRNRDRTHIL